MGDDGWRRQPKRMAIQTASALATQLNKLAHLQQQPFSIVFHGGEPLLVGATHFSEICRTIRTQVPSKCSLAVQTNGVLLSNEIISVCAKWDVSIALSIDGPPQVHDRSRIDHRGRPSHEKVSAAIRRLKAHPACPRLFSGVLAVIDLSMPPEEIYEYLKSTGTPSIDFLYRDGNHDLLPAGKESFASAEYGEWMGRLLDYYLNDANPTPIRALDEIIKLALRAPRTGLNLEEPGIIIVDTDGTIMKNDILKSAFPGADKFLSNWSVFTDDLVEVVASSEYVDYCESQKPCASACLACSELEVCGGGIPAHRWSRERGFINPTIFCADQKYLIGLVRQRLREQNLLVA